MHRTDNGPINGPVKGPVAQSFVDTFAEMTFQVLCRLIGLFVGTALCILGVCVALMPYISNEIDMAILQSAIGAVLFLGGLMLARSGQQQETPAHHEHY